MAVDASPPLAADDAVLIFGCGYLGQRVAEAVRAAGQQVAALTRSVERSATLAARGIAPVVGDWTDARQLRRLPPHRRVLVAVAWDRHSGSDRRNVLVEGLRNALQATDPAAHLCYISTTGVYHQRDGRWVDETSACRPTTAGGKTHLEAEELLQRLRPGGGWTILRMAGLYGPGRVPRSDDIVHGRPIATASEGYLNLIHVEDAAAAVLAAWRRSQQSPAAGRHYVIADGCPVPRRQFYQQIATLTHSPPPRFVPPPADSPVAARAESNKRIWNARMRRELLPRLCYPSFRHGLAAILAG